MGHMAIKTLVGLKSEFARFWSQVLAKAQELRIEEPKLARGNCCQKLEKF